MKRSRSVLVAAVGAAAWAFAVTSVMAGAETPGAAPQQADLPNILNNDPGLLSTIGNGAIGFGGNLLEDLSLQFRAPFAYARRNPLRFATGAAAVLAMIATDHTTQPALRDLSSKEVQREMEHVSAFGQGTTGLYFVAGIGTIGLLTGSGREKGTSVMLAEALVTSSIWTGAIKAISGRPRPREVTPGENDWEGPEFVGDDGSPRQLLLSFPSGHSTGAWAMATILAHQYPTHRVIPILAYAGATAMSYSRIAVNAHWLSDVVVGAVIGIGSARTVVSAHERRNPTATATGGTSLGLDLSSTYQGLRLTVQF